MNGSQTESLPGSCHAAADAPKGRGSHKTLWPLSLSGGIVLAIWVTAASRWILTSTVVPWDSKNQFYAFFRFICTSIHAGSWPFWNPYHFSGHPSVADPQSLIFAPFFMVWAVLDPAPSMQAFDVGVSAHLLAGGLAMTIIGWRRDWPVAACVLAAVLFMFGGAAAGRLQHTGIILSYSLFPPALLMLQIALDRRSYAAAIGFTTVASSLALGRNQVALLLCALLLASALAKVAGAPRPFRFLRERRGVLATMAALGSVLLVVPMLLTIQFANISNRPVEMLGDALKGSLHPVNLATLAVADIFGTHGRYWGPGVLTSPDVALTDDSFNYLFVGVVPLLLLFLSTVGGDLWRPGRRLMTTTLIVAGLFMLGRYTPAYALAFQFIPGIDLFRRPTDASFVFGIALSFLAGDALADYIRNGLPPRRLLATFALLSVIVGILAAAISFSARTGHGFDAIREAALSSAILLVAMVSLAAAKHRKARFVAAGVVTAIAVSELLLWNVCFRLNAEDRASYSVLEAPMGAEAKAISILESALAEDHEAGRYPRVEVLGLGGAWQNLAMVRGWDAINGYNPLRIGCYDDLVRPGEENWNVSLRQFPAPFSGYDSALARDLGLTYLVLGQPLDRIPALSGQLSAEILFEGESIWIYRIPGAHPRAILRKDMHSDIVNPRRASEDVSQPSANSVFENTDKTFRADNEVTIGPTGVKILSSRPGQVEISVTSSREATLILYDLFYPGWRAMIDGKPAPIERADVLFRELKVPAGSHHVSFEFAPFALSNLTDSLRVLFVSPEKQDKSHVCSLATARNARP